MSSLPIHQYNSAQAVFDLLQQQFSLSDDVLVDLTQAFLAEFKLGLGSYNHAMAMM